MEPSLDVVIPVFNEEEVLGHLFTRLSEVLSSERLADSRIRSMRCLLVDDGSRDGSAAIIRDHIDGGFPGELIRLSRNFGHQAAVSAGLAATDADVVAIIDADLQDPPGLIPDMVALWRAGSDVVYGQRLDRKENAFKRACYWVFYRIMAWLSEIDMPLDSGDFCLMDRSVVAAVRELPEKLRFVRGLRAWVGFQQAGLPYKRPCRQAGRPKYTFRKLYQLATDGIASSSIRPLRVAQVFTFCFFVLSSLVALAVLLAALKGKDPVEFRFLVLCFLIMAGSGIQTFCLYIIGAYLGRMYLEVKGRPSYVVWETYRRTEDTDT